MRSVVIFALLAIALCSTSNPLPDLVTGFASTLGWGVNSSQVANINTCINQLTAELGFVVPIVADVKTHNISKLAADVEALIAQFQPAVQTACQPVLDDLMKYAASNSNGQDPETNLALENAYVAQELAILGQNIALQNATAVGETLAVIIKLAVGSDTRQPVLPIHLTLQQQQVMQRQVLVLLTNDTAARQVLVAELTPLGLASSDVDAVIKLFGDYKQVIQGLITLTIQLRSADYAGTINAFQAFGNVCAIFLKNNEAGVEAFAKLNAPILHSFFSNPLQFVAQATFNALFHMPELVQGENQIMQAILAGDWTQVGALSAQQDKIVVGFVYN